MSEIEINGMAHVILTVSRFSEARQFYKSLLPKFGMICVMDGEDFCYHVGGRTAIGIRTVSYTHLTLPTSIQV